MNGCLLFVTNVIALDTMTHNVLQKKSGEKKGIQVDLSEDQESPHQENGNKGEDKQEIIGDYEETTQSDHENEQSVVVEPDSMNRTKADIREKEGYLSLKHKQVMIKLVRRM